MVKGDIRLSTSLGDKILQLYCATSPFNMSHITAISIAAFDIVCQI